jgi:periplasmic divalent cation tolerance protein
MSEQAIIAFSTCPDEAVAQRISHALVTERLAACVNRVSGVRSSYTWNGAMQDDSEILLIIKSTETQVANLERRLKELHPYELPEFVVMRVEGGNEPYLEWIRRNVGSKGD